MEYENIITFQFYFMSFCQSAKCKKDKNMKWVTFEVIVYDAHRALNMINKKNRHTYREIF